MSDPEQYLPLPAVSAVPVLAALDLGTNNCRLLIARPDGAGDGFDVIDSFSRIVRLGEGVAGSGRLSARGMDRTLAALKVCARLIAHHDAARVRCVATEACRRAADGAEFVERVRRVTGLDLEILSHEDEVGLALLGCMPLVDPVADHVLLVDIGGGSTEIAWLDRTEADPADSLRCALSLPVGVVSLTEMFSAEPDPATYEAMGRHVLNLLAPIERRYRFRRIMDGGQLQMLGTSGTVTTLAAVLLDLPRYNRRQVDGLVVDPDSMGRVADRLCAMSNAARTAHPCIGPGRADLVVAGCAILGAILQYWPADSLRVADRGLREGILHSLMGRTLEQALAAATTRAGHLGACRDNLV